MLNFAKSYGRLSNLGKIKNQQKYQASYFYSEHIKNPEKRMSGKVLLFYQFNFNSHFLGVVKFCDGEGADEWVTIEEDVTKNYY